MPPGPLQPGRHGAWVMRGPVPLTLLLEAPGLEARPSHVSAPEEVPCAGLSTEAGGPEQPCWAGPRAARGCRCTCRLSWESTLLLTPAWPCLLPVVVRKSPPSWRVTALPEPWAPACGHPGQCATELKPALACRGPSSGSLPLPGDLLRQLRPHPHRGRFLLPQAHQQTAQALLWRKQRYSLRRGEALPAGAPASRPAEATGAAWARAEAVLVSSREDTLT